MTHARSVPHSRRAQGALLGIVLVLCGGCASSPASAPTAAPSMLQTQQDAAARLKADQQKLDTLVGELNVKLPADSARQLAQSQPRWASLVRDECIWQRDLFDGGSMAPLVYLTCMDQRVRNRIDWLKMFLCEGYGSTGQCAASARF